MLSIVASDHSSVVCFVVVVVVLVLVGTAAGRDIEVVVCSVVVVFDTVSEPQPASKAAPVMRTAPVSTRRREVARVMMLLRCQH